MIDDDIIFLADEDEKLFPKNGNNLFFRDSCFKLEKNIFSEKIILLALKQD
jgi:hypothetical protein